jgi:hypothetical protein
MTSFSARVAKLEQRHATAIERDERDEHALARLDAWAAGLNMTTAEALHSGRHRPPRELQYALNLYGVLEATSELNMEFGDPAAEPVRARLARGDAGDKFVSTFFEGWSRYQHLLADPPARPDRNGHDPGRNGTASSSWNLPEMS